MDRYGGPDDPDKISGFIPAEDVTSEDNMHDVTADWIRTPSNAANEAAGTITYI